MTRTQLFELIKQKQSYLCVGLDSDLEKLPKHLLNSDDPIFEFNKQIIDATLEYAIAYKPNLAFYEALGSKGWESLQKTIEYIPKDVFTIADAKRGDIGNTSSLYAKAFFDQLNFDAITVAPYMGQDSVSPFIRKGKWVILLALTSNPGSKDFQLLQSKNSDRKLYEEVFAKSQTWATADSLMYVVGATNEESFSSIRLLAPDHFLLVPGVGAQGGNLAEISKNGMNKQCGLIVNSSRSIIYASYKQDFAEKAHNEAKKVQEEMKVLLDKYI